MASGGGLEDLLALANTDIPVVPTTQKAEKTKKINYHDFGIKRNRTMNMKDVGYALLFDASGSTFFENFMLRNENVVIIKHY